MGKKIYQYFISISLFLVSLSVKVKSHRLCALILWLNIRKSKSINHLNKKNKKVLVFPKSGGYEDLIESYNNKNTNNIIFFLLPRIFLKRVFLNFFENDYERDYYTKLSKTEELNKKKKYIEFLSTTFKFLSNFIKFDGYISFNIFYYAEKYFEEVCIKLDTKFIILHKESALNPSEEVKAPIIYGKYNDKSLSYRISVYSESQKKILLKSKIANKKQIIVNGTPRSDYAFKLRKIAPKGKIIVFYLIEYNRTASILSSDRKLNWNKLYNQTLKYLLEFANKNPNIQIVLKGKTGVHNKNQSNLKDLPKNCSFIDGGVGHAFLKNASVVIAFNSTIVFETIASNRNLIIPNFNNESKIKQKYLHKIKNKKYFANSRKQFDEKVKFYLDLKYKNKKLSGSDKKTLKYFLGNTDATSGSNIKKFLDNTLKC